MSKGRLSVQPLLHTGTDRTELVPNISRVTVCRTRYHSISFVIVEHHFEMRKPSIHCPLPVSGRMPNPSQTVSTVSGRYHASTTILTSQLWSNLHPSLDEICRCLITPEQCLLVWEMDAARTLGVCGAGYMMRLVTPIAVIDHTAVRRTLYQSR